jgi:hypothetical protein
MVPANSHKIPLVSCYSGYCLFTIRSITGLSPSLIGFPIPFISLLLQIIQSYNPISIAQHGLGFSAFARHYLRNHFLIFSSYRYLDVSVPYVLFLADEWSSTIRVPPFGHLWIKVYLQLPIAFRSLSRPSSSLRA